MRDAGAGAAWAACRRSDWMLWCLSKAPDTEENRQNITCIAIMITLTILNRQPIERWDVWAASYIAGKDRSVAAAMSAADATNESAEAWSLAARDAANASAMMMVVASLAATSADTARRLVACSEASAMACPAEGQANSKTWWAAMIAADARRPRSIGGFEVLCEVDRLFLVGEAAIIRFFYPTPPPICK